MNEQRFVGDVFSGTNPLSQRRETRNIAFDSNAPDQVAEPILRRSGSSQQESQTHDTNDPQKHGSAPRYAMS
jgi:hypothetical protein